MIEIIVSVINFILILVLYIVVFTKSSKEMFTGTPSGYTNLLVSDSDGNLDTFSLSTLESDIDAKISTNVSNALKDYTTTATLKKDYATIDQLYKFQPKGDYLVNGVRLAIKSGSNVRLSRQ